MPNEFKIDPNAKPLDVNTFCNLFLGGSEEAIVAELSIFGREHLRERLENRKPKDTDTYSDCQEETEE